MKNIVMLLLISTALIFGCRPPDKPAESVTPQPMDSLAIELIDVSELERELITDILPGLDTFGRPGRIAICLSICQATRTEAIRNCRGATGPAAARCFLSIERSYNACIRKCKLM